MSMMKGLQRSDRVLVQKNVALLGSAVHNFKDDKKIHTFLGIQIFLTFACTTVWEGGKF